MVRTTLQICGFCLLNVFILKSKLSVYSFIYNMHYLSPFVTFYSLIYRMEWSNLSLVPLFMGKLGYCNRSRLFRSRRCVGNLAHWRFVSWCSREGPSHSLKELGISYFLRGYCDLWCYLSNHLVEQGRLAERRLIQLLLHLAMGELLLCRLFRIFLWLLCWVYEYCERYFGGYCRFCVRLGWRAGLLSLR